ncbi:radical SAM protein [uncultured Aquimarina sp.]|uniref:SPL family radical SAM protein n=1 Tax=uncultured Aquimarina sp. TaxID=575652 RepID=UPI00261DDA4D|nr:radical SAM protein [uncultured Aquimarina sp.]
MPKEIIVKSILNKTKKRDSWFLDDYTLNPYSSCSFNCLYCYIRGSKYGTNLESSLSVKMNTIELLDKQLFNRAKKNQYGIIVLSSATDPYLQVEKKYQLTREALKIIANHKFPVHIITKSDLVERDFDILDQIDKTAIIPEDLKYRLNRGTIISFSFSTLSDEVGRIFEPGATKPSARLKTLESAVKNNFFTGVSLMPLLPFISDTTEHLNLLFKTFKGHNAHYILPATITLFGEGPADSKILMLQAIKKHYPDLENKYIHYFKNGSGMPTYYKKAFHNKMKELCSQYQISDSISTINN